MSALLRTLMSGFGYIMPGMVAGLRSFGYRSDFYIVIDILIKVLREDGR
jgi:hypothetical protein